MKKIMAMLLSAAVAVGMFAGCGAKDTKAPEKGTEVKEETKTEETVKELMPEEGATLKVWESDGPELEFMQAAADAFKAKYPDVEFELEPVKHNEAKGRLALDGPAGVGADVFAAPHNQIGELAEAGLILENENADLYKDQFISAAIAASKYKETVYGYPVGIETYALFYNKDVVTEPVKTWDELKEFAKTYNDKGSNKYALMFEGANAYYDYMFLGGYGAELFGTSGEDENDFGFTKVDKEGINEKAIEAMNFLRSIRTDIMDVPAADITYDVMIQGFESGQFPYMINGPWAIKSLLDNGVNFGITELPTLPNGNKPQSFSGVRNLHVSAYTEYPVAAQMFAEFCSNLEMTKKRFEITNQIPVRVDYNVEDEYVAGIMAQAAYAKPMPSIPKMGAYWNTFGTTYTNVWEGKDPKAELEAAKEAMINQ